MASIGRKNEHSATNKMTKPFRPFIFCGSTYPTRFRHFIYGVDIQCGRICTLERLIYSYAISCIMEELIQKQLEKKIREWEQLDLKELKEIVMSEGECYIEDGEYLTRTVFWGVESDMYGITEGMSNWAMDNGENIDEEFFYALADILNAGGINLDLDMGDLYLSVRMSMEDVIREYYDDTVLHLSVGDMEKDTTEWYPASEFEDSWPGISLLYGMCARPVNEDGNVDASDEYIFGIDESIPYLSARVSKVERK